VGRREPDNFRFIVKVPRQATDVGLIGKFLEDLATIEEKVLAVMVQVPAEMTLMDDRRWLDKVLAKCVYHGYSAALEFGHGSWFQDMAYNILRKHGAAFVCSDQHHPVVTSDLLCLRLAGNNEKEWIEKVKEQEQIEFAAIIVDSPEKANKTLELLSLPKRKYAGPLPTPSLPYKEPWKGRVVMCVDLNALHPSCEEVREPALKGRPHAVIMTDQMDKVTKSVVSSCSYEDRRFGVSPAKR